MTVKLIAYYEHGWFDNQTTDRRLYDHLARCFEDTKLQMIERWDEADTEGKTVIILAQDGAEELKTFVHPAEACYVFGRSGQNDMLVAIPHDISVKITTPNPISMFGSTVAGMVLWDRWNKQ